MYPGLFLHEPLDAHLLHHLFLSTGLALAWALALSCLIFKALRARAFLSAIILASLAFLSAITLAALAFSLEIFLAIALALLAFSLVTLARSSASFAALAYLTFSSAIFLRFSARFLAARALSFSILMASLRLIPAMFLQDLAQ